MCKEDTSNYQGHGVCHLRPQPLIGNALMTGGDPVTWVLIYWNSFYLDYLLAHKPIQR